MVCKPVIFIFIDEKSFALLLFLDALNEVACIISLQKSAVDGKDVNVCLGGYLRVGCKIHTIEWWRENWQATAEEEDVDVDEQEAMAIIAKAERIISQ